MGISLKDGKILVEGAGTALQAQVDELNQSGPADFVLVAPPVPGAATPAAATPAPATAAATPSAPAPSAAVLSAPAPVTPDLVARNIDQLFQAYVHDVGTQGLQAVAYTNGHFVIRTGSINTAESNTAEPEVPAGTAGRPSPAASATGSAMPAAAAGKLTPAQFVARYANVRLEKGAAIKTEDDIYGGQGYLIDNMAICSAGFGAFSPTGLPLVLTAGHCAEDGTAKTAGIEPLTSAPAGGSATPLVRPPAPLGRFGFSQFGGPNNSAATADGSSVGSDIAVIQDINPALNLQPAATKWDNPGAPGPGAVRIVGTTAPFQGQEVCRSGRTTGWKCGTVDSVGIWMMPGSKSVPPNYDDDLRPVRAFDSTSVKSAGGDSGGPWISGNYAVGTHTGAESLNGVQTRAIAATLEDSLASIPGGVQLQLFLNKPELVAPATPAFTAGTSITGRVPAAPASAVAAHSKFRVTVAGQQPLDVPVDAGGNWSFKAPETPGPFTFSAETVNGFSRSGAVSLTAVVAPLSLSAPAITTPATAPLPELKNLSGKGTPGSTVTLSGEVTGTGTVGPDGQWSVTLNGPAAFGKVTVTAVLSYPGLADSPAATGTFTVVPPAPAISSLSAGQHLRQDAVPANFSGSGIYGAEVTVSVDGIPLSSAPAGGGVGSRTVAPALAPLVLVSGGGWSVPFPAGLAPGAHTVSVTQAIDGVASAPAAATFAIDAPPPMALASTGATGVITAAGFAGGALGVGVLLMVLARRRRNRSGPPAKLTDGAER